MAAWALCASDDFWRPTAALAAVERFAEWRACTEEVDSLEAMLGESVSCSCFTRVARDRGEGARRLFDDSDCATALLTAGDFLAQSASDSSPAGDGDWLALDGLAASLHGAGGEQGRRRPRFDAVPSTAGASEGVDAALSAVVGRAIVLVELDALDTPVAWSWAALSDIVGVVTRFSDLIGVEFGDPPREGPSPVRLSTSGGGMFIFSSRVLCVLITCSRPRRIEFARVYEQNAPVFYQIT